MSTGDIAMATRPKSTEFPEIRNAAPGLTPEQFIDKIIALRPMIRAQQDQADEAGAYTGEVHEALLSFGAYGVVQPRCYGGHEFDPETLIRATIEMARSDPSAAWCWAFPAAHVIMLASHYDEGAQHEIFGRNDGVAIAPLRAPTNGTIRKVKDGYIVNGTWDYASGVPYATHVMPTARLIDDANPGGPPVFYVPILPAGDFRIVPGSWGGISRWACVPAARRRSWSRTHSFPTIWWRRFTTSGAPARIRKGRLAPVCTAIPCMWVSPPRCSLQ
ncbi:hypothetical protein [Burkholderia sp. AU16741]|uniref:hypothetical protein n=1 Tax=Burkholderia sp. AU16741 TaxID=2015347 RepID=UPI0015C6543D|nr:hypothetical protein [Burkholderia sp. AU16741]